MKTENLLNGEAAALHNNIPTPSDFRTAARVNRWVAQMLDERGKSIPLWKRIFMEYPVKDLRVHAVRFEDAADRLERLE